MLPKLRTPKTTVGDMAHTLKLKDAGSRFRQLVKSFRTKKEECIVQDERDRPVAVVLPIERYESYQVSYR